MDIKQIEARLKSITPSTWMSPPHTNVLGRGVIASPSGMVIAMGVQGDANAEFIAHAPKDIADLLEEVESLKRKLVAASQPSVENPYLLDVPADHPWRKQWDGGGKR